MSAVPDESTSVPGVPAVEPIGHSAGDPPGKQDLRRRVDGIAPPLAGGANVVMQLAWREVAYGVMESPIDSGSVTKHPLKRARTTLTYLAVAMYGDADTRLAYRRAIDDVHQFVRSTPSSPVKYNAFDPELQLWVASCLYYGSRDIATRLHGPMDEETEAAYFRAGRRMATTLQVPEEMWHKDLASFEAYFADGLRRASIDERTASYLRGILNVSIMPFPLSLLGGLIGFFNVGFLPPELRQALDLPWTERQERRHRRVLRALGAVLRHLPEPVRVFPFNWLLVDVAIRRRLGRSLL